MLTPKEIQTILPILPDGLVWTIKSNEYFFKDKDRFPFTLGLSQIVDDNEKELRDRGLIGLDVNSLRSAIVSVIQDNHKYLRTTNFYELLIAKDDWEELAPNFYEHVGRQNILDLGGFDFLKEVPGLGYYSTQEIRTDDKDPIIRKFVSDYITEYHASYRDHVNEQVNRKW